VRGAVKSVALLRSGTTPPTERNGDWMTVTVPRLLIYEAIRVDLA